MASSPFPALDCFCYMLFFHLVLSFLYYAHGRTVPAMYVLGDSLVDVGNNNYLPLSLLKANFPHNGIDYAGGRPTGRFSNGKNGADFLAEELGLRTPPPYLSLLTRSNKTDAFLKGVNFASGGAGILESTNKGQCLTFDTQIKFFSKVYGTLVQQLGSMKTQKHVSQSIIVVVIGSNDLLVYFSSGSSQQAIATPQQYVDLLVSTLSGQLRRIYNLGARKFVFLGTGVIGCCPAQRLQNRTRECNVASNDGSILYNKGVITLLEGLKSELGNISYSFSDTYATFLEYIQSPATYGFVDVKAACCGLGDLNANVPCIPIARYCSNRSDHAFWDLFHPTEIVSRMVSESIFNGSPPYVFPINVQQLAAI